MTANLPFIRPSIMLPLIKQIFVYEFTLKTKSLRDFVNLDEFKILIMDSFYESGYHRNVCFARYFYYHLDTSRKLRFMPGPLFF